ncbi:hypothetical protein H5S40_03490 [Limosilactobacillus sp. RRLNB_1_1]|uniref:Prophage protein n=1 Tax=Limosilactobacillus albertensis TaxID=2759752 RepID=A0A7W3TQU7_9LACO|nr:hypothetical protein [Limosilactobacillus albertensis]MBB1069217.1 hypothetical protein [Limosilactobacillus albertensis]MCD7118485.1 hypothetical protein [Limosilactobacillus albertensis]MCD7128628.1 hypothetical protein [Limosilactobacillus albertensis]
MIKITFSDGTVETINKSTKIVAWKSTDSDPGKTPFYRDMAFEGSYNDGTEIATKDPLNGISGLIGSTDWFSIGKDKTLYKTSAVVKLELID